MEEKPMLIFQKNTETTTNKMRMPKFVVEQWGTSYYMEIYNDYIKLIPVKNNKEKGE